MTSDSRKPGSGVQPIERAILLGAAIIATAVVLTGAVFGIQVKDGDRADASAASDAAGPDEGGAPVAADPSDDKATSTTIRATTTTRRSTTTTTTKPPPVTAATPPATTKPPPVTAAPPPATTAPPPTTAAPTTTTLPFCSQGGGAGVSLSILNHDPTDQIRIFERKCPESLVLVATVLAGESTVVSTNVGRVYNAQDNLGECVGEAVAGSGPNPWVMDATPVGC